jgi:hypothetical protein
VLEVQTILLKLSVVDNGPITVRQLHLTMSLTGPVPVDCERSTVLSLPPTGSQRNGLDHPHGHEGTGEQGGHSAPLLAAQREAVARWASRLPVPRRFGLGGTGLVQLI